MDLQTLQQEHEELLGELRGSTEKTKKASCEVKRHDLRYYSRRGVTLVQRFE